jgi:CHAT domain
MAENSSSPSARACIAQIAAADLSERGQLADYAILHFATHGALSGQVNGSAEPGLILTPPPKGTSDPQTLERDDGFLTASEITTLKLDADWVILSACDRAGAQGEGADALSGMARAFYAGARALLVSQGEVDSDAAVKLTTGAIAELKAHPVIGRAEAFRISMKEPIKKGSLAEAHPRHWAPFVIVGEGADANALTTSSIVPPPAQLFPAEPVGSRSRSRKQRRQIGERRSGAANENRKLCIAGTQKNRARWARERRRIVSLSGIICL